MAQRSTKIIVQCYDFFSVHENRRPGIPKTSNLVANAYDTNV